MSQIFYLGLKPIFHQNAKYLASGAGVGQYPDARLLRWRYQHVGIKNVKICVSRRQTPDAKPKICVSPDAKPRRQPVEYRWRWVLALGLCVGHVHFIFFVLISFALGSRRRPSFQWNMGFSFFFIKKKG